MTEEEARRHNQQLLERVTALPEGECYASIIDQNVEFESEPLLLSFLTTSGRETTSTKLSNASFNLRATLLTGVELGLAFQMPDSLRALALICLSVIIYLDQSASVTLSDDEASLVEYLHAHDGYAGIVEDDLISGYAEWRAAREGKPPTVRSIRDSLYSLNKLRTIEVANGIVYLKEKIFFRI